jgi:hypothetical protein
MFPFLSMQTQISLSCAKLSMLVATKTKRIIPAAKNVSSILSSFPQTKKPSHH